MFAEKEDGEQNDKDGRGELEYNSVCGGGQLVGNGKQDIGAADSQRSHQNPEVYPGSVVGQPEVQANDHQSDRGAAAVDGHTAPGMSLMHSPPMLYSTAARNTHSVPL